MRPITEGGWYRSPRPNGGAPLRHEAITEMLDDMQMDVARLGDRRSPYNQQDGARHGAYRYRKAVHLRPLSSVPLFPKLFPGMMHGNGKHS